MTDERAPQGTGHGDGLARVTDPDDPRLAPYRALNDPDRRRTVEATGGFFVVEGRLAVERLVTSDYAVRSLLVDDHQATASAGLVADVLATGAPVYVAARDVVATTVGFSLHRGVVAVAGRPAPVDADRLLAAVVSAGGDPPVVAVLEGLNDHENVGALFRNAAAFGVAGVLCDPTCADPLYRRSVRVSMGHVLHVPFARLDPWPSALGRVRAAGFVVAALTPHPPPTGLPPWTSLAGLRGRRWSEGTGIALLLGAEGPGLSGPALGAADVAVGIPMAGGVDSLNVATAAAVAMHALGDD